MNQQEKEKFWEQLGYDAGKNGADLHNCHFRIFETIEGKNAWTRGFDRAKESLKYSSDVEDKEKLL